MADDAGKINERSSSAEETLCNRGDSERRFTATGSYRSHAGPGRFLRNRDTLADRVPFFDEQRSLDRRVARSQSAPPRRNRGSDRGTLEQQQAAAEARRTFRRRPVAD
jgi:hypothetical protein